MWSQVDLKEKRIVLTESQTKSGKARVLPLSNELIAMMEPKDLSALSMFEPGDKSLLCLSCDQSTQAMAKGDPRGRVRRSPVP